MSHTPGPWNLERDCNGVPEFVFGGDTCVCDFGIETPKPEDARLITAAPELLEVFKADLWNVERVTKGRPVEPPLARWLEKARAVLAKVRGDEARGDEGEGC